MDNGIRLTGVFAGVFLVVSIASAFGLSIFLASRRGPEVEQPPYAALRV